MTNTTSSARRVAAHLGVPGRGRARGPRALLASATLLATAVVGVLAGAGGSYALWNGSATTDAGVLAAGFVDVSGQLALPAYRYRSGSTTTTGSLTVSDAGDVTGAATMRVSFGGATSPALAQAVAVTLWPVADAGFCTSAATPVKPLVAGSFADLAASTSPIALAGSLPPGMARVYCVRTSLNVQSVPGVASGAKVLPIFTTTLTAGSWAESAQASAQQNFVDDIAPTAPPSLTPTHTTLAATTLTWQPAMDNVAVTGYTVYRDGTAIATTSSAATTFTDASVDAGSSYTYTVKARDAVGQYSAPSPAATVTVPLTDPNTWYQVTNVKSGMCVSSQNSGSTDGTTLTQSACSSPVLTSQSWQFRGPNSDGYYTVVPRNAATLAWDISGAGTTDGTPALLRTASGATNQQWRAVALGGGRFQYVARHSGKCLQVSGGSTTTGAVLQQITCNGSDTSQIFQLSAVTPLSTLVCSQPNAWYVQYSWAAPVAADAATAGYAMFVNGQPSIPATTATRDWPHAQYSVDNNPSHTPGRVSIEIRQQLVSGGEVWVGTGSVIVGSDNTYTCG